MTGEEYIQLSNRVKVSAALRLVSDLLPGKDRGITETERAFLVERLSRIERELARMYEVIDDD